MSEKADKTKTATEPKPKIDPVYTNSEKIVAILEKSDTEVARLIWTRVKGYFNQRLLSEANALSEKSSELASAADRL